MVKVIGDGKEYEFKDVSVSKYNSKYDCYKSEEKHYSDESQETIKEESKQEFVSVPKEIQFAPLDSSFDEMVLVVGNHYLAYHKNYNNWQFESCGKVNEQIDCVLVPTKREDLKAGDWAFCEETVDCYTLSDKGNYSLILNVNKEIYVQITNQKLIIEETDLVGFNKKLIWFKVVPRSETEGQVKP